MTATPLAMQSFHNQNKQHMSTSPFSGGLSKPTPEGSPYLPGYLLGGNAGSPRASMYGRSLSTSGYQKSNSYSKLNSRSPPHSVGSPYQSPPDRKQRLSPLSHHTERKDRIGAPPTESLYGSTSPSTDVMEMDSPPDRKYIGGHTSDELFMTPKQSPEKTFNTSIFSPRQEESLLKSPAQVDPFYAEGDAITSSDVLEQTAVTVFGFPPAAASYILQQFSQYGTIENYEIHNTGNWLHIKYQTKIQAKKALSKNGKIFARSIMIGVCPCIRKQIASMEAELQNTDNLNETPKELIRAKKPSTMRSLTSATTTPLHNTPALDDILSSDHGTPQKKSSVVSKALDYVFGW